MANRIKKDTLFTIIGLVISIAAFIGATVAVSKMVTNKNSSETVTTTYSGSNKTPQAFYFEGKNYKYRENIEAILLMGIDDRKDYDSSEFSINNSQADVLYLFVIDHKNKTYQRVQIHRDSMTPVQTYAYNGRKESIVPMQICLAHSYGKNDNGRAANTVEAVSTMFFDAPVNHYISLKMESVSILNDKVGGVTVKVPAGLEEADPAFISGSEIKLSGNQALTFVQARMSLSNDNNSFRMERQEIFLNSWKNQAYAKMNQDSDFAINLVLSLSDYLVSDMSAYALSDFANQLKEYQDLGTIKVEGNAIDTEDGVQFIVDQDALQRLVIDLFYVEAKE